MLENETEQVIRNIRHSKRSSKEDQEFSNLAEAFLQQLRQGGETGARDDDKKSKGPASISEKIANINSNRLIDYI